MSLLSKTVAPKTKAELIRALQAASFRSVDVYEGDRLIGLPQDILKRSGISVIILR